MKSDQKKKTLENKQNVSKDKRENIICYQAYGDKF